MAAPTDSAMDISSFFSGLLNEKLCPNHLNVLKSFTSMLRRQEYREEVEKDVFCSLWSLLSRLREELEASGEGEEEGDELNLQLMAECFRAQRNACVQSPRNQALLSDLSFIDESLKVISVLQRLYLQCGGVALDPLRCGLQFLGNIAVGNQLCKDSLWTLSLPHLMLMTLLELLAAQLGEGGGGDSGIPGGVAAHLASSFQTGCRAVLALASGSADGDEEALTVISLLDVLCEMTSDLEQFMFLQDHAGLLQATVALLQEVHALGKASKNVFSSSQNFSSSGGGDPSSPSVSFKAHLIRLIGNLCHRHPFNQNQVRELDGIPLILDNCSIDSNNPFISQWAIFAIRNILEQNQENQALVAAMDRRGNADYSALSELGLDVEKRDGALLLKTTKKH
ncbi:ataxin-10 isoform X2 [Gadus macrocephalus]|uniref:ataxin-10 isoform X2 n=1 Tax=Gadus macrocephalus TaxID=80720 RepID=UPI0028CB8511|nr:ataxin-10 isoform X2 [Gadus macrocephalus]